MTDDSGKVLVCYATGTGCTRGVAERISETLAREGLRVDVRPVEPGLDPAAYDAIVAGSGVRAGSWHPVAKRWMTRNAAALRTKPVALFTVGIAMAHGAEKADETRGVTDRFLGKTGLEPLNVGAFAGWYDPRKFNVLERNIMRIAKAPEGDHRDWTAIENWATGVARMLLPIEHVAIA